MIKAGRISGSPPRMRGKAYEYVVNGGIHRITPAYAGKSSLSQADKAVLRDHPRVCGEKTGSAEANPFGAGSPPRMRGKVVGQVRNLSDRRITPAYAGKRMRCLLLEQTIRDHPRVCGEKKTYRARLAANPGSPPRMRGKVAEWCYAYCACGITPAYAGKSTRNI